MKRPQPSSMVQNIECLRLSKADGTKIGSAHFDIEGLSPTYGTET